VVGEGGERMARDAQALELLNDEREGMLLTPDRFGEREVKLLEAQLGPYQAAGQLQQRPEPKGGGIFKRDWWQLWNEDRFPPFDYILASLDTAYTEKEENDPSALTIWGIFTHRMNEPVRLTFRDGSFHDELNLSETAQRVMLMNAWSGRLEINELVEKVNKICSTMRVDRLLIESKASGISVAQELKRLYGNSGFTVQLMDPRSQDKVSRAYSIQHLFSEGLIYAPDRSWADMVITQCAAFPKAKHDDLVDTVTQALKYLRGTGILVRGEEVVRELEERVNNYDSSRVAPMYF
jgi:predicted phage terminase large subunit-like protein